MSKIKPILFNTDMVRAILAGRKTVTRRVVKPQPLSKLAYVCMGHKHGTWGYPAKDAWKYWDDESFRLPDGLPEPEREKRWTPPCHTGDILYVRETWDNVPITTSGKHGKLDGKYFYKADGDIRPEGFRSRWYPSIHMPREAARIFLRVTGVKAERLQSMTEADAVAEGFEAIKCDCPCGRPCTDCMDTGYLEPGMLAFVETWSSTIKPADRALYGWDANPWVWVIEFERCRKPEEDT